ncbi:hypothetical protein [Paraburkholderia sp. RAU2J]|uniref:hypothetical protein n=1 Tax=Paraburkholderia sp. RAU2J TaxID=1938810 RepID=UPI0011C3CC34|nr:hypothetical protein [Paraburkholderia sp. RAU2J]
MNKSALKLLVFIRLESNPLEQRVGEPDAMALAFRQAIDRPVQSPTKTLNANHSQYWASLSLIARENKYRRSQSLVAKGP